MELKIGSMIVREPVLIRIYYYLPDYSSLVQEFIWGTMDIIPEYPRFNGMCAFGKKAYLRIESILSNPMNRRAVIAVVILLGFVILAMSFGYIK